MSTELATVSKARKYNLYSVGKVRKTFNVVKM